MNKTKNTMTKENGSSKYELLAERMKHERELLELKLAHEKELRESQEKSNALALELKSIEYEKRLSDLNHAHREQVEDKAKFLLKETYETFKRDFDSWKETLMKEVNEHHAVAESRAKAYGIIAVVISSIFGVIIHFWH
jgi:hypothetical protein